MIVRPKPGFVALFTILRGSILSVVAPQIIGVAVLSVAVVAVQRQHPAAFATFTPAPFTLLGLALSIFLSFRNTACYDRWWEGRRQWGQLVLEMRAFARLVTVLYPGEAEAAFRRQMLRSAVGFAHALAARLRGEDEAAAAGPWVAVAAGGVNVPDAVLTSIAAALAERPRRGSLDLIPVQMVEVHVAAMSGVQAACERILTTPLPFAYSLLLQRTAYMFCGLVPFGLAPSMGWFTPVPGRRDRLHVLRPGRARRRAGGAVRPGRQRPAAGRAGADDRAGPPPGRRRGVAAAVDADRGSSCRDRRRSPTLRTCGRRPSCWCGTACSGCGWASSWSGP